MMAYATQFRKEDIPYEGLSKLGFEKEALDNMPAQLRQSLLNGEVTPLVEANVRASNGAIVTIPLRMQLIEGINGENPSLVVYPVRREIENNLGLSKYELERVQQGEVIQKELIVDNQRHKNFVQLDPRTNSLVHQKISDLKMDEELKNMESIKDIQLGSQQKDAIREGRPVELKVGDEKVVVGVNLNEPHGFKVMKGDMEEWKRKQEENYDVAHPEFMGFVKTDRNRWEYQQVVKGDDESIRNQPKQERSAGMRM